jgi:hypothetical protein
VRLIRVTEHLGRFTGQGWAEDAVAQVGLGAAAGAEVVRGAADTVQLPVKTLNFRVLTNLRIRHEATRPSRTNGWPETDSLRPRMRHFR